MSLHIFVRLHCALEAVGSSPHKTCSHKTYTTIDTGWSHYPARQQATTSTYRWSEGVARCKHKCVCMCMYLRMYVCTMLYACMCVLCMHVCVYVCHASVSYHLCTHSSIRLSLWKCKTPVGSSSDSHAILRLQMESIHSAKFPRP